MNRQTNMLRQIIIVILLAISTCVMAQAGANLEVDSPSISIVRKSLVARFAALRPLLDSGTVGLTRDGLIAIANADNIHPTARAQVESLVNEENKDRSTLYREIARANGRPDWESDLRLIFGERWAGRALKGWLVHDVKGAWVRK